MISSCSSLFSVFSWSRSLRVVANFVVMILSLSRASSNSRERDPAEPAAAEGYAAPLLPLAADEDPPLLPYCMLFSKFDFVLVVVVVSVEGGIVDSR